MLISVPLPDGLVPQISIILYNRTMTKKEVEVLSRNSQSTVVNQNLELGALFSIPFLLKGGHTKMGIADAHKIGNSIFKTKAHLI